VFFLAREEVKEPGQEGEEMTTFMGRDKSDALRRTSRRGDVF